MHRMFDRRDVLKLAGLLAVPSCGGRPDFIEVCGVNGTTGDFDSILDTLHTKDPEWEGGLSNHGPMAAQVLFEQGRSERLCAWVGGYIGYLEELPAVLPVVDRVASRGNVDERAAWVATYAEELPAANLQSYLRSELPPLMPGFAAAAFHGALRTGHALRAFANADTPARRIEIAHGLAHWASRYRELPGLPGSAPVSGRDVVTALDQLDVVPYEQQQRSGFIHERMTKVDQLPTFAEQIARVDLAARSVDETVSDLTAAAARLYIADRARSNLGYLHALDGASIFRSLLPYLDPPAQRAGLGYVFQAVAALHATHASFKSIPRISIPGSRTPAILLDEAAKSDDEHTIKFVAACVYEHSLDPRDEFLWAAELRLQ